MTPTPDDYDWRADGQKKIAVIKKIRALSGMNLKDVSAHMDETSPKEAPEEVFSRRKYYVLGFMFNADRSEVQLIRKARPEWQAGRLNGIGGKIEDNETPEQAMRREFEEEAGVATKYKEWQHVVTMRSPDWTIYVFGMSCGLRFEQCETMTDEPLEAHRVDTFLATEDCISNLHWLVPLVRNPRNIRLPVTAEYER